MQSSKQPFISQYSVVTLNRPVNYQRTEDETWPLNPPRRYLFNALQVQALQPYIESISDLEGSANYKRLTAGNNVTGARILVERYRERGIGDLLFLTGPFAYLHHITGGNVKLEVYALSDRGAILSGHPFIHNGTALCGPIHYDDLPLYDYHWFIPSVTECDEERDQLNVYDALFQQLGFDPAQISPKFKRPFLSVQPEDSKQLDRFFYFVWAERKLDLRRSPYYVVAPFTNASLRALNYGTWLQIIKELATRRPVVVVGLMTQQMPYTDMSAGAFQQALSGLPNVINALDVTKSIRVLVALIAKANVLVGLDSAPLYIAQALGTPAISIWGTHDPGVRLGYDQPYMDSAIHLHQACCASPCYAYANFPVHKCPQGQNQSVCEVLMAVEPNDVLKRLEKIEAQNLPLGAFSPKPANEIKT